MTTAAQPTVTDGFPYRRWSVTSSTPSASNQPSLIARLSRGYFGWLVGTVLGVTAGLLTEEALRTAPTVWAVVMVGVFLAACAIGAVLARLLYVALGRRMRQHQLRSERQSFRLQLLESLRSPAVIDVLKAAGTSALVAIMLTSAEFNLAQASVLVPVIALMAVFAVAILVLEIWLDPELRIPLPRLRRRSDR